MSPGGDGDMGNVVCWEVRDRSEETEAFIAGHQNLESNSHGVDTAQKL